MSNWMIRKMGPSHFKRARWKWFLVGVMLSLGAPIGLVIVLMLPGMDWLPERMLVFIYVTVSTTSVFGAFGYLMGRNIERIRKVSNQDPLTRLNNRRFFYREFQKIVSYCRRYDDPLSLIMLDLDHFKKVNDEYGHLVGDKTLISVARCLTRNTRETDLTARFGGEEFVIALPNTPENEALALAERIRTQVEQMGQRELGHRQQQTISAGVYQVEHLQEHPDLWLDRVDKALYASKHQGRNRVTRFSKIH